MAALRRQQRVKADRIVVGLGNPGAEYAGTRHNAGFLVLDELARRHRFPKPARLYHGRYSVGLVGGSGVGLLAPHTFMNESGRSVAAALRGLGLSQSDLLVVHDHIDLPFGRVRLSHDGGTGGHNGLKSLHELVGKEFDRVRVGVDRPPSTDPDIVADYVTSPFVEGPAEVRRLIEEAADAVEAWLADGLAAAADRFNR
jgi:peptidyl-tRNA hydrolase, PTH1 family